MSSCRPHVRRGPWLVLLALTFTLLPTHPSGGGAASGNGGETYAEHVFAAEHDEARRAQGGTAVVRAGTTELVWSAELHDLARSSSARMAQRARMDHDPAIREALCCGAVFGDNVGRISRTPADDPAAIRRSVEQLMSMWLRSSGHRSNMLDARFTHIGVGVVIDADDTLWVTAVFQTRDATVASGTLVAGGSEPGGVCAATIRRSSFTDVHGVHADAIECLAARGIIEGVSPTHFDPASTVTRGQLALLLTRTIDASGATLPPRLDGAFSDVRPEVRSARAVEHLAGGGIALGRPDGRFQPNAPITRAQFAAQLAATLRHLDGEVATGERERFIDVPTHRRFSRAIDASAHAGLIAGDADGRFHPDTPLRRDQTASLILRLLELEHG